MEVLQLEILVQGRPVVDALNQMDSITIGPLSRKARTFVPWNHQPMSRAVPLPCLVRSNRGLEGSPLFYARHAIENQNLMFKFNGVLGLSHLCIPRCLWPKGRRVPALALHQPGVRW